MNKWILSSAVFAILLAANTAFSQTKRVDPFNGLDPLPGANVTEQEIAWAWQVVVDYVSECSFSPECNLNADQVQIAKKIMANRPLYSNATLVFAKESEKPFTSSAGETERLAMTGQSPGTKIFVNRDQAVGAGGKSRGVPFWMGLFAHELAHHLGILDDSNRVPDQFGSAIAAAALKHLVSVPVPESSQDIAAVYLNTPLPGDLLGVLREFPHGMPFRSMKIDSATAYDDANVDNAYGLIEFCKGGQYVGIRLTPEMVRVSKDPLHPGSNRAHLWLASVAACYNSSAVKPTWGDLTPIGNDFSVKLLGNGHYVINTDVAGGYGVRPDDGDGAFGQATLVESKLPSTVAAGSTLVIDAKIRAPRPSDLATGCSGYMTSDAFAQFDEALPTSIEFESCKLTSLGGDLYAIHAERKISAQTPSMKLEMMWLCLNNSEPALGCWPAHFAKQTFITVINPAVLPAPVISKVHFERVNPSKIDPRIPYDYYDTFDIVFDISHSTSLHSGLINYSADLSDGSGGVELLLNFTAQPPIEYVKKLTVTPQGDGLHVVITMKLALKFGGADLWDGLASFLNIVNSDLQNAYLDLTPLKLILVPREAP